MSGQVSGVRGRGPDDTGLVIQAPDRGGEEGFLRALGAGERGRTASAGQGTRDLILRGRVTREPGVVPGVMFFGVCEGAQSAVHNLADRGGAGSTVHDLGQDGLPDQISVRAVVQSAVHDLGRDGFLGALDAHGRDQAEVLGARDPVAHDIAGRRTDAAEGRANVYF